MSRLGFLGLFLGFVFNGFCQSSDKMSQEVHVDWCNPTLIEILGEPVLVPCFSGQTAVSFVLYHNVEIELAFHRQYTNKIENQQWISCSAIETEYLERFCLDTTNFSTLMFGEDIDLKSKHVTVSVFPFSKVNQMWLKLVSYNLVCEPVQPVQNSLEKDFALNSVLSEGSGNWLKVSVTSDAVYKVSGAYLRNAGLISGNVPSDHLHVFGSSFGKLPELNSAYKSDDLKQLAISVEDGGDGIFNEADYLLFYGNGPHRWYANGLVEFEQDRNIYSDKAFYFINVNAGFTPKRISNASIESGSVTHVITSSNFYDCYENDAVNLVKGGQRWYGEKFDVELERSFSFNVPQIESTAPVKFKVSLATNASTSGNTQSYLVNGNQLLSAALPIVSKDYVQSIKSFSYTNPTESISLLIKINRVNSGVLTYLDRIILNARRKLTYTGNQFGFRDMSTVGIGNVGQFNLEGLNSNCQIWEVTNGVIPSNRQLNFFNAVGSFVAHLDSLRQFVVFEPANALVPTVEQIIENQNLHGLDQVDLLIVSPKDFISEANRLADLHREEGLKVHVVDVSQVYNEFSGGMQDPGAIRMFAKMFYDRGSLNGDPLKYLLLFGDGSYDPKNRLSGNLNFIPTYQFPNGENSLISLVTDDFFGLLDDADAMGPADMVDIGVGRLLISSATQAKQQVDKIEHYMKNGSTFYGGASGDGFGDWKLNYVQIADDEENGYFINQDTEKHFDYVRAHHPEMNAVKLYADAFLQESSAGGQRYPDVNNQIDSWVDKGALIVNYVGHGGERGFAQERILTIEQIQSWKNINKLNLLVSATCEFTRFDDPSRYSAGELASLNPIGGSIALMTTARSVFFGVNSATGESFYEHVFERDISGLPLRLGDIIRKTKNGSGSSDNKRCFVLIGDPALRLALPTHRVVTDSVNGVHINAFNDTLKALSQVRVVGHIEDYQGNVIPNFNGYIYPTLFDKPKQVSTLGQDPDSPVIPFEVQRNIIYKGKGSVNQGRFNFEFIVPKDINYSVNFGKMSYYAHADNTDAGWLDSSLRVGSINPNGITDDQGPIIDLAMNDFDFIDGGLTNQSPKLLAKLNDESGINTVGNGIGHDITAVLDNVTSSPYVLNDFYSTDLDTYKSGSLTYGFDGLQTGAHSLRVKAWDVNNNPGESTISFVVRENGEIALSHVLNYPNPFTTNTAFYFEHNQAEDVLDVRVQIYSVSGLLVKTILTSMQTNGYRSQPIYWDGKDDFGDQLANGVYVYKLAVQDSSGKVEEKIEKLFLIR